MLLSLNPLVGALQLQVEDEQSMPTCTENSLTLRRLLVWMYDPKVRLKTLAALVDFCQGWRLLSLVILWLRTSNARLANTCLFATPPQDAKGVSWLRLSTLMARQATPRWGRWCSTSLVWCRTPSSTSCTAGSMMASWKTPTTRYTEGPTRPKNWLRELRPRQFCFFINVSLYLNEKATTLFSSATQK